MNQDKNCFTQVGTHNPRRRNSFPTAANSLFVAQWGELVRGNPYQLPACSSVATEPGVASSTARPHMEQQLGCSLRPCLEQQLVCSATTAAGFVAAELELLPVCSSVASNQEAAGILCCYGQAGAAAGRATGPSKASLAMPEPGVSPFSVLVLRTLLYWGGGFKSPLHFLIRSFCKHRSALSLKKALLSLCMAPIH